MNSPSAWGQTFFCDDVRQEVGGKISLIGIYNAEMVFAVDFPIMMPKLVVFVRYYEKLDYSDSDLIFQIYVPGDAEAASLEIPMMRSALAKVQLPDEVVFSEKDAQPFITIALPVTISPFNIKEEGYLRVRVKNGADVIKIGSMCIRKLREGESLFLAGK